jgi:hypothetical protein
MSEVILISLTQRTPPSNFFPFPFSFLSRRSYALSIETSRYGGSWLSQENIVFCTGVLSTAEPIPAPHSEAIVARVLNRKIMHSKPAFHFQSLPFP